jgi:hypothetical protein
MDVQTTYNHTMNRPPQEKELFLFEGALYVYRGAFPAGRWRSLGAVAEENVPELGLLDFELQEGIVARGTPSFVLSLLLRAFYGVTDEQAPELVGCIYNVFRECGWKGPAESDDQKIPGTVEVTDGHGDSVHNVDDLRVIFAQLQDPEFNGWLSFDMERTPETPSSTIFLSVGNAHRVKLTRAEGS